MNSEEFLADVIETTVPSDSAIEKVRMLVLRQMQLEDAIERLETDLKKTKEALIQTQEVDLPSALQEHGMSQITMTDGSLVNIRQEYYGTIKEEKRSEAFAWLEQHGHVDLIKHDIVTSFTKGQDDEARRIMGLLEDNGIAYEDKRHVHTQTLRAFIKEQIEDGKELPIETFSVHIRQVAKIKREKKQR